MTGAGDGGLVHVQHWRDAGHDGCVGGGKGGPRPMDIAQPEGSCWLGRKGGGGIAFADSWKENDVSSEEVAEHALKGGRQWEIIRLTAQWHRMGGFIAVDRHPLIAIVMH